MHPIPELVLFSILATVGLEAATVVLRFGLDLRSTRDTAATVGVLTCGVRIHHGYVGLVLLAGTVFINGSPAVEFWAIVAGNSLFFSDLIHHFCVLWPITGKHEFDLRYR